MRSTAPLMSLWLASTAAAIAQVPSSSSPPRASPPAVRGPSLILSIEAAQAALDACKAKGVVVSASVVDSAGILRVLLASDGANAKAVVSSTAKAVTAKDFGIPIGELPDKIAKDPALAAKAKSNPDYVIGGGGGLPMRVAGAVIGAIGVGGGHGAAVDEGCARAGLDRISARLQ